MQDYSEPICCFDASSYTGSPDSPPSFRAVDVYDVLKRSDSLRDAGDTAAAEALLVSARDTAAEAGDWSSEITMLSELAGLYRYMRLEDRALSVCSDIFGLLREHHLGHTVAGATVLLNAATTLTSYGRHSGALDVFAHVSRVYMDHLDPSDYRFASLFNNMAAAYKDSGEYQNAERCYNFALSSLNRDKGRENDIAVTLCNLADLYNSLDPEDGRVNACMERAWEYLNAPGLPRDAYHRFTISKCLSAFDSLGYFAYAKELRERLK